MNLQLGTLPLKQLSTSCLAIGVFEEETPELTDFPEPTRRLIQELVASKEIKGSLGEVVPLYGHTLASQETVSVWVYGLGKRESFSPGQAYSASYAVAKKRSGSENDGLSLTIPQAGDESRLIIPAMIQGAIVGRVGPGIRKAEPKRFPFTNLKILLDSQIELAESKHEPLLERARIVGEAINRARELVNTPSSEKPPTRVAELAQDIAKQAGFSVEIWNREKLIQERFGGLIQVGAGSEEPPTFAILTYRGLPESESHHAWIGKGITFDSGGLSLKPSKGMEDMKADMAGSATVLAAVEAVAKLKLPVNVVGYLALAENMPGGRAMKLGDVLTMRNGKTVEVMNTDAEGRLVLADALSYAVEQNPVDLLDLATLTGACVVALGGKVAGLMSNQDSMAESVRAASRAAGERLWPLPMDADYFEQMKSNVADFKNVGGREGGAITAAKFLEQFVAEKPWVHLDIAGPSFHEKETSTLDPGATGCFVRTLVALADSWTTQAE